MKKVFSLLLSLSIIICAAVAFSSCGSIGMGSDRSVVKALSIYLKKNSSSDYDEFLIKTGQGDWLDYKIGGEYSFSEEQPEIDASFTSSWAVHDYAGRITNETSLSGGENPKEKFYSAAIKNYIGDKMNAMNVVVLEGYFFINEYSSSTADKLYKENVVAAYTGYIDSNGNVTVGATYNDGRVFFCYTQDCSIYERDGFIYSYHGDKEIALFEDTAYHRPLQHDNTINVFYTGAYMYFEVVRDCAGYFDITHILASLDGAKCFTICSRKVYV